MFRQSYHQTRGVANQLITFGLCTGADGKLDFGMWVIFCRYHSINRANYLFAKQHVVQDKAWMSATVVFSRVRNCQSFGTAGPCCPLYGIRTSQSRLDPECLKQLKSFTKEGGVQKRREQVHKTEGGITGSGPGNDETLACMSYEVDWFQQA
jgi:hypothetical protein